MTDSDRLLALTRATRELDAAVREVRRRADRVAELLDDEAEVREGAEASPPPLPNHLTARPPY